MPNVLRPTTGITQDFLLAHPVPVSTRFTIVATTRLVIVATTVTRLIIVAVSSRPQWSAAAT